VGTWVFAEAVVGRNPWQFGAGAHICPCTESISAVAKVVAVSQAFRRVQASISRQDGELLRKHNAHFCFCFAKSGSGDRHILFGKGFARVVSRNVVFNGAVRGFAVSFDPIIRSSGYRLS
jgi:hypothetical protein